MPGREPFVKFLHVEIALPRPRLVMFDQERPDETVGRCGVGEDPDHPLPSADLLIQALRHVGRTQPPAVLLGEHYHAHGVLEALLETGGGLGGDRLKARDEPRCFNPLKKSSQAAKDSESPIARPRISRTPSSRMPVAMRAAFGTTRSSSRTVSLKASTNTNGYEAVEDTR